MQSRLMLRGGGAGRLLVAAAAAKNGTARRVLTRASSSWDEAERASGGVLGAAGNKEGAVHRQATGGGGGTDGQQRFLSMSALRQPDPAPPELLSSPPSFATPPPPGPSSLGLGLDLSRAGGGPAASSGGGGGKVVPFLLADIGEGIAEVEMMQWFVREGDSVKQFDRLCEVQSDKATVEISSRYDGVIKRVYHGAGAIVQVGTPLVDIELPGDEGATAPTMNNAGPAPSLHGPGQEAIAPAAALATPSSSPPPPLSTFPLAPTTQQAEAGGEIVPTTPAVRRLAKEYGVDLSLVQPTGPQGRVLKGDVLEHIRIRGVVIPPTATAIGDSAPSPLREAPSALPQPMPPPPSPLSAAVLTEEKRVPVRGVMRRMAKSMTTSLQIPHFGYQDEVVMDKAVALRESLRPLAEAQGVKLSYLPIMLKAASMALLQYPILNASLSADQTEVIYHPAHNIGVAMDTPKGLVVPVLKNVQDKSLFQIARELTELQVLGAKGGFTEEHFTGATFSLSNIGSIGGTYMDAKIVPPQVAIGAIGKIQTLPRFVVGADGQPTTTVVPTRVMAVSWAGDHRVLDGATMARFSNLWKAYLEEPAAMLAELK